MNDYQAHRPVLRDDCGLQIQGAWQQGQWPVVINHAKAKAKATKDPYFEVSPGFSFVPLPRTRTKHMAGLLRVLFKRTPYQSPRLRVYRSVLEAGQYRHSSEASYPTHLSNTLPRMVLNTEIPVWISHGVIVMICCWESPVSFYARKLSSRARVLRP